MEQDLTKYYKILGLLPGASTEQINQAYYELVDVWHPDRFAENSKLRDHAKAHLKEINIAYGKICSAEIDDDGAHTVKISRGNIQAVEKIKFDEFEESLPILPQNKETNGASQQAESPAETSLPSNPAATSEPVAQPELSLDQPIESDAPTKKTPRPVMRLSPEAMPPPQFFGQSEPQQQKVSTSAIDQSTSTPSEKREKSKSSAPTKKIPLQVNSLTPEEHTEQQEAEPVLSETTSEDQEQTEHRESPQTLSTPPLLQENPPQEHLSAEQPEENEPSISNANLTSNTPNTPVSPAPLISSAPKPFKQQIQPNHHQQSNQPNKPAEALPKLPTSREADPNNIASHYDKTAAVNVSTYKKSRKEIDFKLLIIIALIFIYAATMTAFFIFRPDQMFQSTSKNSTEPKDILEELGLEKPTEPKISEPRLSVQEPLSTTSAESNQETEVVKDDIEPTTEQPSQTPLLESITEAPQILTDIKPVITELTEEDLQSLSTTNTSESKQKTSETNIAPVSQASSTDSMNFITVGSSEEDVVRIMGEPTSKEANVWFYKLSSVTFSDRKVTTWNSTDNDPLTVKLLPRQSVSNPPDFFTIGSSKDVVLAVQGTPRAFSDSIWYYGLSVVMFSGDKVISWTQYSDHPLKAHKVESPAP
ncbi:MAG: DnaJ domain-containing protein [Verrucomicrobiota bacterium]